MTRTYLLRVRLSIAVSAAQAGLDLSKNTDLDVYEPLWPLLPEESLLLSTDGDSILLAHTSALAPAELLNEIQRRFDALPLADVGVLQLGARCRSSDEADPEADQESEDSELVWDCSLADWLADGRLRFDVRPSFGPKALVLTTEHRPPRDLRSVRLLRQVLPDAKPHWQGRNTLMLTVATEDNIEHLWSLPAVRRVVDDAEISFAACVEIGPAEADMHGLELVLPGCQRRSRPPQRDKQVGAVRTVTVQYSSKRGAPKLSRASDLQAVRPANDPLPEANDNRRVTQINVLKGGRRPRRP